MRTLKHTILALLALVVLTIASPLAAARDVVTLKDGRRVEGDIIREIDGNIWMIVYIGEIKKQEFFAAGSIDRVVRDATPDEGDMDEAEKPARAPSGNIPKGEVITLEGMVGIEYSARHLESLIPQIEKDIGEGGILVLKINSGGGALLEIQPLSDVIEFKLKPKFETVGWIESAISAAAMNSITLERLYFMPQGNFGACTGWYGNLTAVKGRQFEEAKEMMRKIVARGGYDYKIMEAMQGNPEAEVPLSATIDPQTGEVTWYTSEDDGEILVNPGTEVLTFNAVQAEQLRFSQGTARTLDELAHKMGYEEVDWVGDWQRDLVFPVGPAERENRRWREFIDQNHQGLQIAVAKYRLYLSTAQSTQGRARAMMVGKARKFLRQIKRYFKESPNSFLFTLNLPPDQFKYWYEDQQQLLRDLMKP